MLVPFAAGLISGDAVFASSSLEKSKMLIGRGKKNLADAVDKNDVNCDEELSLSENKAAKKSKNVSNKNTKVSRFGPLEVLGMNGAAIGIGMTSFSVKELVEILQKNKGKDSLSPNYDPNSNSGPGSGPTTIKEKPYGDISLWIKENPTVFSLVVILFTAFLIFNVFFHVRNRRAIKKLNEKNKELNEEFKKSNEEIKELNEILDLNEIDKEIDKKLNKEIDKEIVYLDKSIKIKDMELLEDFKNYKTILKQIISGNTDKTLTLILSNNNFSSVNIFSHVKPFYTLAGRFYDTLGGFWYVVPDEEKIKENLKKDGSVDFSEIYSKNATKININFFSINNYLTKSREQFDKISTKNFYNDDFEIGRKMFEHYYGTFFLNYLTAPYRDYEKKLEILSELGLDDKFFNKHQEHYNGKDNFLKFTITRCMPRDFYRFLSHSCLYFLNDDRDADRIGPEIRIRFIKHAVEKLIKDEGGKYKLSDENKTFLKYRFNAFLLFGKLIDAYCKKTGVKSRVDTAESKKFNYLVLNWCRENIKYRDLLKRDEASNNEVIFFLARMVVEYLTSLVKKKEEEEGNYLVKTFGEILDIYKGNPVTIYNYNNKFIDHLKYAEYLKDANIDFQQIQFMKE